MPSISISCVKPRDPTQVSDDESRDSSKDSSEQLGSDSRPLLTGKDDSGESSNADKWFDKSNNNATALKGGAVDSE